MPGLILAAVNPDNTPHGYNWTFAFPMLLFIVIALILYALFSRPHRRVPGRPISGRRQRLAVPDAGRRAGGGRRWRTQRRPGGGDRPSRRRARWRADRGRRSPAART